MRSTLLILTAFLLTGCSHYEYDLTQPVARHIGEQAQTVVPIDPLVYRFQSVEDHLIVWIQNTTSDPILLVGDHSVIVDPFNQSHTLASRTIAPGSYIKMILPPLRPWAYTDGPVVVVGAGGFGWGYRHRHFPGYRGYYFDDYYYDGGPGYVVYGGNDPELFRWDGQTNARVNFMFDRGGKRFEQSFTFHRQEVKG